MSRHWAPCVTSSLRDHQERTEQWRLVRRTASKYCNCAAHNGAQCVEKREGSSKPRLWSTQICKLFLNFKYVFKRYNNGFSLMPPKYFWIVEWEERFLLKTCWHLENILWKWIIFVRWIWQCDTTPKSSVVYMNRETTKTKFMINPFL